jgi:mono/diheme cytochrome c family protein
MQKTVIVFTLSLALLSYSFVSNEQDFSASFKRGKVVYEKNCLACHQVNGAGVPRMNPPLIKTKHVLGDKIKLINIVIKGFNEEVEINGEFYDNPMPAQVQLNDQQVADVLTYVRNSFGNKATAIKVAEVKAVRVKK